MKRIIIILTIAILFASCTTQESLIDTNEVKTEQTLNGLPFPKTFEEAEAWFDEQHH